MPLVDVSSVGFSVDSRGPYRRYTADLILPAHH